MWWAWCRLANSQNSLSKLQRLALLGITGSMRIAPTADLEALLNLEHLHIHLEAADRSTALPIRTFTNSDANDKGIPKV